MLIRPMKIEDIKQVANIEAHCFSLPWSEESFKSSLQREYTIFLVCEQKMNNEILTSEKNHLSDETIMGYVGMYLAFDEGEIVNVAVAPFARQKGIGDTLIKSLKAIAKEKNIQRIVLEVRKSNQPAIHLYEKNNFVFVGVRKNFYEKPIEDANIMICEI